MGIFSSAQGHVLYISTACNLYSTCSNCVSILLHDSGNIYKNTILLLRMCDIFQLILLELETPFFHISCSYNGSVRGSLNGTTGNFTNGTIGSQWHF